MATTGTAERVNHIQSILTTRLVMEHARSRVWDQFPMVPPEAKLGGADSGDTVDIRFQRRLDINTDTLLEKTDIVPSSVTGQKMSITIVEHGDAVQRSELALIVQKGNLDEDLANLVSAQHTSSLDRLAGRAYFEGNAVVLRPNGVTARSGLDSTNDALDASGVGISFLSRPLSMLRAAGAPGDATDGNGQQKYMTVINPVIAHDLIQTAGFLPALQQREGRNDLFNGEVGEIMGLRFMVSEQGKVYPGAGNLAQATTLNGAVLIGATSFVATSASGIAVGDILTIGVLEDGGGTVDVEKTAEKTENVLVTAVAGTTITIAGLGFVESDVTTPGFRYAHATLTAVTEADLVAAMPVFGPQSAMKAYAVRTGPMGEGRVSGPFDVLGRFVNVGWYAVLGYKKTIGIWTVRIEVATKHQHLVLNQ